MTFRASLYRGFQRSVLGLPALSHLIRDERRFPEPMQADALKARLAQDTGSGKRRIWFHAASAGELESIWTVIVETAETHAYDVIVTVFSPSGILQLSRLARALDGRGCPLFFAGAAPLEGRWDEFLCLMRPACVVTAKYEAWPELWISLSERNIPLIILGAMERGSLRLAKRLCRALGTQLPEMAMSATEPDHLASLERLFPGAEVALIGEARWDKAAQGGGKDKARPSEILSTFANAQRPWGILAQIWSEDLEIWQESLAQFAGTLWIVPHKVDAKNLELIRQKLKPELLEKAVWTSALSSASEAVFPKDPFSDERRGESRTHSCSVVVVDEMGVLLDLYDAMDWAYVGGGFGQGTHSTIEPAVRGLPIAIGPNRAEYFPEIRYLRSKGQLEVIEGAEQLSFWIQKMNQTGEEQRGRWRAGIQEKLGATKQLVAFVRKMADRR